MNISAHLLKKYLKVPVDICIKTSYRSFSLLQLYKDQSLVLLNFSNPLYLVKNRERMDLASVIKVFEEHVPPTLAETWDNTGLLIEPSNKASISTILFTNDLTEDVLKEAITEKSDLIISYHPPIFSPIKSLKQSNWKDRIVIKSIENGIAVYSPHTGCDAVYGGVNDWLINSFDLSDCKPIMQSYEAHPQYSSIISFCISETHNMVEILKSIPDCEVIDLGPESTGSSCQKFSVKVNKSSLSQILKILDENNSSSSISVTPLNPLPLVSCGMGRVGKLTEPMKLGDCIKLIKMYLNLNNVRFSKGVSHSLDTPISSVAVCAGSGSSVLKGVSADLYITGEMSHHDLLDTSHRNVSVILCEHSNSERGYLQKLVEVLNPRLAEIKLIVSSSDKDPISIV